MVKEKKYKGETEPMEDVDVDIICRGNDKKLKETVLSVLSAMFENWISLVLSFKS